MNPSDFFEAEENRRASESPLMRRIYGLDIRRLEPDEIAAALSYEQNGASGRRTRLRRGFTRCQGCGCSFPSERTGGGVRLSKCPDCRKKVG
jgi:predicted Zn-ribbon and HTH transcriptional regulator